MKQVVTALLSVSIAAIASDEQNRVQNLLAQSSQATELDWHNKNLGNKDFEGLSVEATHVKKLDLSNNSFTGDFALTKVLLTFPNLETLTLNNHERMTSLVVDKDYKNTKLKVLNVENSGCEKILSTPFYNNFELETLDLSNSKKLIYCGCGVWNPRASGKMLQVHIRNVVAADDLLQSLKENGVVDTQIAQGIKVSVGAVIGLPASILLTWCSLWSPSYCMISPLPPYHYDYMSARDYVTFYTYQVISAGISCGLGHSIGGAIARRCLPNGGKVTAVKYITSSVDETV